MLLLLAIITLDIIVCCTFVSLRESKPFNLIMDLLPIIFIWFGILGLLFVLVVM